MASPSRINGTTRLARQSIFPDPAATPREASAAATGYSSACSAMSSMWIVLRSMTAPGGSPPATDLLRSECNRNGSVVGHNSQLIALAQQHHGVIGAAQAAGRLHDFVQDRLEIVRRGSDDSKK